MSGNGDFSLRPVTEGELLWTPSDRFAHDSGLAKFERWLERTHGLRFADYQAFWRWSVTDADAFWVAIWDYFAVRSTTPYTSVRAGDMPRTRWFPGCSVNFAEHLLRHEEVAGADDVAIVHFSELREQGNIRWHDLGNAVRVLATQLREFGVEPGDRVVAYMPNIPETAIAMMAATAIGAVWSAATPEFGAQTVIDRFAQISPKILFAADGYRFGGKNFDRRAEIDAIVRALPTLERIVWLPYLSASAAPSLPVPITTWADALAHAPVARDSFAYERVGADAPLWILYSSGTTGLPKAIVHSHVGILLEQLKSTAFNSNLSPSSRMFFYSTTGWMMWNALMSALLQGASIVLYDGHPASPEPDLLWRRAAETGVTLFGTSPTYAKEMQKRGLVPKDSFDLGRLEAIFLSGSPATPETFVWFYENVKADMWLTSQSGGTDFCGGLVGSVATLPVYAGEIQGRILGMDVHAWNDDGAEVTDEIGELVVTSAAPSMPLYFWNDPGDERYGESYFSVFPGVWRHGDFIKINARGGCYVYGRSDATLNRFGVRIGSAEIYRALERMDDVADSLIVCLEMPDGGFYMPLFVEPAPGVTLDEAVKKRIVAQLRTECSPRHVPDEIHHVPEIPYTLSAKKMELPVRKILRGAAPESVAARDAMRNPKALDWFVDFARSLNKS